MGSIQSVQDLDSFLNSASDQKKKSQGQSAMAPPPVPASFVGPKQALQINTVQDLDAFIKSPIEKYNPKTTGQERVQPKPGEGTIGRSDPSTADQIFSTGPLADVPLAGSGFRVKDFYRRITSPTPEEEEIERRAEKFHEEQKGKPLTARSIGQATDIAISRFMRGQVSPGNVALLLTVEAAPEIKGLKLLTELGFGAQAAQGAYQQASASKDAIARGDYAEGVEGLIGTLASGTFAYGAGKAGVHTAKDIHGEMLARLPLDNMSREAFGKNFKQLTEKQQAAVMYDLAKQAKAPIAMEMAMRMAKGAPTRDLVPEAQELVEQQQRARRETAGVLPTMRPPQEPAVMAGPPEMTAPEKRASEDEPYVLPGNEASYMSAEDRAQQYYTLESARGRLDEERKRQQAIDQQIEEATSQREREALDRRQQSEGEAKYRAQRQGKVPVVSDRRGLEFDVRGAEGNRQEYNRLSGEMDRIAQEHMYTDTTDMLRSIGEEKGRGKQLDEWKRNILDTENRRREFLRRSDPRALEPTRTEKFEAARKEAGLAVRELAMRDVSEKLKSEAKNVTDPEEFNKRSAEAEEARQRAEELRSSRDKAMAARAAQTAERQIYPLGAPMTEIKGRDGEIILPDRSRRLKFHYAVVPLSELIVSHDPLGGFEQVAEYPDVLQPRDYKNNKETQAGVIAGGQNPEAALVISDAATGHEGPPVVRADGVVAGGNGRTMRMLLAHKNGFGEDLGGYLAMKSDQFGIDSEKIPPSQEQPILVRVLDESFESAEELARLGRDLNRTETMGFSNSETAVAAGRAMSSDTLDWVTNGLDAMGDEASLRDFMRRRGNEIVERMVNSGMIEATKRAEFITSDGEMTEKAKDLFEAALLGKVIDDPALLATTPKEILRKLERSIAALARIKDAGGLWDITPELKQSLSLWKRVDSVRDQLVQIGTKDDSLVDKYLNPGKFKNGTSMLIDAREVPHPTVEAIAKTLEKTGLDAKKAFTEYSNDAEGKQITLGPPPNPVESFNRYIGEKVGVEVPPDLWGVLQTAKPGESIPAETEGSVEPQVKAQVAQVEKPVPQVTPPALSGGVSAATVQSFLEQHPGTSEVAGPLMDAMGTVVKNALGIDLDTFLKQNWADVRSEGEPGAESLGQDISKTASWARSGGKKLTIEPFGEQQDLFGGAERQYLLRKGTGQQSQEAMVLQSQLRELREMVPRIRELTDDDGNLVQSRMFDAPPTLGAPEDDEPPPPRQTNLLFQEPEHPDLDIREYGAHTEMLPTDAVVQLVPTNELDRFKEFDRRMQPFGTSIDKLKEDIQANGIREPLILKYGREDRKAHLWEGNHRLAAAKELGIKEVPVRVISAKKSEGKFGVNVGGYKFGGDVPEHLKPSDIGLQGRPLGRRAFFQDAGRELGKGATEFLDDGRAIVYMFKGADASTFIHEFFHTMRRYLKPEDMKTLEDWMKVKDGRWSRAHEEKAARAFEYYHRESKAQTLPEKVRAVFTKIQSAMREIYAALKGSPLVKPSKQVSELFDRWYGKEMAPPPVGEVEEAIKAAKVEKEKIPPAAEMDAPPLSKEERESAIPIGKAGSGLDTGKVRTKIFRDFEQAKNWAFDNKDKLKGAELARLPDGRVVVDFTSKKENVLFQIGSDEELEIARINSKLADLNRNIMRMMPDEERVRMSRQIRDLTDRSNSLQAKRSDRPMQPPPGQVVTLWTPEGERPLSSQPREAERGTPPTSNVVRTVFNEPPAVRQPDRHAEVSKRAESPRVSGTERSAGRSVQASGRAEAAGRGASEPRSALRDVDAIRLAPPERTRQPAAYAPQDWAQKVKDYRLPENAPAPTVKVPKELSRMLMPGQTEIVESVLSGLKQHDAYILGTTTGTGKTFMGSAIIQQKLAENPNARIFILTPSQGLIKGDDGWVNVANNFGVEVRPMPAGEVPQEPGVFVATWASMLNRPEIELQPWDLVLADEVQEARRWFAESQRGQKMKEMGGNAKKVLYMSATPFHTALEIGHMDKLGLWRDIGFEPWGRQMGVYRDKDGNLAGGRAPMKLAKLRQQLIERGQMINIDRNMDGYSAHFGVVPMDGETAQGLDNIAKAMQLAENYFQSREQLGKIRPTRAQAVTLAKRWLEWQRLPHAIELAKKLEKQGWKTIFFSENKKEFQEIFEFLKEADEGTSGQISKLLPKFGSTTEKLQEAFGDDIAIFAGPHSAAREGEKNGFMSNHKKHLYATYGAGGVGVSLHDKLGDYPRAVIYLGPPWSGISFDQALGRPWRYGTKSNVRAYFLFSNSEAEMDIITNKVAPRMESLRAMVSGVNFDDPVVKNLRSVPETKEATLDYELGNEHKAGLDSLRKVANRSGVHNYAELPIVNADEAKQKGMRLPGDTGAGAPSLVRLWQGGDEEATPPQYDAPEVTLARATNVSIGSGFIESGAAPGRVDMRSLSRPQRAMIADTVMATAEAAARDNPTGATQAVYTAWENSMKQLDAFMSARPEAESGGMAPPPNAPEVETGEPGEPKTPGEIGVARALDMYLFTNGRDVIRNAARIAGAPEVGEKLARNIEQYHVRNGEIAGPWSQRFWKLMSDNKISREEFKVAALTLAQREDPKPWIEKEIQRLRATAPMNERIAKVVDDMGNLFGDVFKKMAADEIYTRVYDAISGKPRDVYFSEQKGGPYWPRRYDYDEKHTVVDDNGKEISFTLRELTKHDQPGGARKEQIINGMMKRHGLSRAEVEDWLASKKRQVPLAGNVERAREADLPFFRTDPDVVIQYLEDAAELLSRKEYFGQDGSKAAGLLAQIPDQKARAISKSVIDSLLARQRMEPESRQMLRFAADWAVLSKMTFAAIKVLGHPAHGALLTNTRSFLRGILKSTFDYRSSREAAMFAGSINEQVKIEQLAEFGITKKSLASRFLQANLWQSTYKWGRVAADATARVWMEKYAMPELVKNPDNQRVRRQLRNFMLLDDARIDRAIENKRWLNEDVNWAAKALSDKVMFTNDPTELPPLWRARSSEPVNDLGLTILRTATMLKGYQFKTHALLKDAIWDEAKKGNFRPLIPFLTVYPLLGQLIWSLTALATVNRKHFQQLLDDKNWEPGKVLERGVEDIAHMIGDTQVTAFLEAYLGGKAWLGSKIASEYAVSPGVTDAFRTLMMPSEVIGAKTPEKKYKAAKRWAEETFPATRSAENAIDLMSAPPSEYEMRPAPVYPR